MMKKRIRTKGHYRTVEFDEKGRFTKVEKWSSKGGGRPSIYFKCDECGKLTKNKDGYAIAIVGGPILELCPKCFRNRSEILTRIQTSLLSTTGQDSKLKETKDASQ